MATMSAALLQPIVSRPRARYLTPIPTPSPAAIVGAGLDRLGTVTMLERGRMLFQEQDPAEHVFKVLSGALRAVRLLPDGRRYITEFLLPGDYVGLAETGIYSQTLEAVADTKLVKYSRRRFEAFLDADARAGRHFFGLVCGELSAAQDRQLLLGRKCAIERIASFLLAMADRQAPETTAVDLPMSRSDIADYLGLTIETVSRVLGQLKAREIIDVPTVNRIVFTDREALEDISAGE
jgi:CRP/FNR family transcriptional regulator, anaerobic regulatory protein